MDVPKLNTLSPQTGQEFLLSLKSDTKVLVGASDIILPEAGATDFKKGLLKDTPKGECSFKELNPHIRINDVFDGLEYTVKDVSNLFVLGCGPPVENIISTKSTKSPEYGKESAQEIKGQNINSIRTGSAFQRSRLLCRPRYAYCLTFDSCSNIAIVGMEIGHLEKGFCAGGVLRFINCKNISLESSVLFGSGTEGICLEGVRGFRLFNSMIRDCTFNILTINGCERLEFLQSSFISNGEYNLINISRSRSLSFTKCHFEDNGKEGAFFSVYSGSRYSDAAEEKTEEVEEEKEEKEYREEIPPIIIRNSFFKNNRASCFTTDFRLFRLVQNKFEGNSFDNTVM
ncbi:MAG: right-handed parallel beta-helix repeat-containing protein [Thermoplasmata archaeon]